MTKTKTPKAIKPPPQKAQTPGPLTTSMATYNSKLGADAYATLIEIRDDMLDSVYGEDSIESRSVSLVRYLEELKENCSSAMSNEFEDAMNKELERSIDIVEKALRAL